MTVRAAAQKTNPAIAAALAALLGSAIAGLVKFGSSDDVKALNARLDRIENRLDRLLERGNQVASIKP